ncbi:hypothetical protein RI367_005618 [Sorochytrium milnesiophthora]
MTGAAASPSDGEAVEHNAADAMNRLTLVFAGAELEQRYQAHTQPSRVRYNILLMLLAALCTAGLCARDYAQIDNRTYFFSDFWQSTKVRMGIGSILIFGALLTRFAPGVQRQITPYLWFVSGQSLAFLLVTVTAFSIIRNTGLPPGTPIVHNSMDDTVIFCVMATFDMPIKYTFGVAVTFLIPSFALHFALLPNMVGEGLEQTMMGHMLSVVSGLMAGYAREQLRRKIFSTTHAVTEGGVSIGNALRDLNHHAYYLTRRSRHGSTHRPRKEPPDKPARSKRPSLVSMSRRERTVTMRGDTPAMSRTNVSLDKLFSGLVGAESVAPSRDMTPAQSLSLADSSFTPAATERPTTPKQASFLLSPLLTSSIISAPPSTMSNSSATASPPTPLLTTLPSHSPIASIASSPVRPDPSGAQQPGSTDTATRLRRSSFASMVRSYIAIPLGDTATVERYSMYHNIITRRISIRRLTIELLSSTVAQAWSTVFQSNEMFALLVVELIAMFTFVLIKLVVRMMVWKLHCGGRMRAKIAQYTDAACTFIVIQMLTITAVLAHPSPYLYHMFLQRINLFLLSSASPDVRFPFYCCMCCLHLLAAFVVIIVFHGQNYLSLDVFCTCLVTNIYLWSMEIEMKRGFMLRQSLEAQHRILRTPSTTG